MNIKELDQLELKQIVCPFCKKEIKEVSLWTEEDNERYHFSCYNYKQINKEEE